MDYYAMFLLGFVGSGHCIGMCGPLVLAIPGQRKGVAPHLLYHGGRVLTYGIVGGIVGGLGSGIGHLAAATGSDPLKTMAGIQMIFSVIAALFLIWFGLSRLGVIKEPAWMSTALTQKVPGLDGAQGEGAGRMFLAGLALGLLPCGLSYAAFARSLAAQGVASGAGLAFSFGLGTAPVLLIVGLGAAQFFRRYRRASDVLAGILMIGMAVTIAVRIAKKM